MALGTLLHVGAREALHQGMGRLQRTRRWREDVEHATAGGQGLGTAPMTEQPVMAQALEAAGEPMEQEAPDELGGWEGHHLDCSAVPIMAVYLSPADNCEGPLLYCLPGVNQPVISTANGFSALRSTL